MNQKTIVGLGLALLLIVLVQSVFLYRMSNQVNQLSTQQMQSGRSQNGQIDNPPAKILPQDRLMTPWSDKDWNPFEEMQRMQNEMNKIFGDMRSNLYKSPDFDGLMKPFSFSPTVDIQDDGDRFIVKVDIPGSDDSNINVKIEGQRLTINATTRKSGDKKDKGNMYRSERFMGQFERSVTLPEPVQADKMKTDYQDGVLTITIPKA